jgi:hypothetical protein
MQMANVDFPRAPVHSSWRVQDRSEGIQLVFQRRSFTWWWLGLLLLGVLALRLAFVWAREPGERLTDPRIPFFVAFIFTVTGSGVFYATYWNSRSASVTVGGKVLVILEPRWVGSWRHIWNCADIQAIADWQGLQITERSGRTTRVLTHSTPAELMWLAEVLRRAVQVPEELPATEREVSVRYTGPFWPQSRVGFLLAEPGKLTLRHSFDRAPYLCFALKGALREWVAPNAIPLEEHEITCRPQKDGGMALEIAPTEATCRMGKDGLPEIRFKLFGPILYESVSLDSRTTIEIPHERPFQITIWSADEEALPRALAHFWGQPDD